MGEYVDVKGDNVVDYILDDDGDIVVDGVEVELRVDFGDEKCR